MISLIMNRIELNEQFCCGCSACASACAHNAISMVENDKGFWVPTIDEEKCVDCGICSKVCDFKKEKRTENNIAHAYSLVIRNKDVLYNSTSGGAFTVISDYVLAHGGIVVGAVMEPDFTVHHVVTSDIGIRDKMRGSKYVQSDLSGVYRSMREMLQNGKMVLFSGTPCQCAAIRSYFGNKFSNLIVVDLLCHGVPSNKMFKEHISYLEHYYGQKLVSYFFRDKEFGWDSYNNKIITADGKSHSKWTNQIYYNFFVRNLSLRDACFNCPYRSLNRPSDLTIADFWSVGKLTGKKSIDGVSLVLTHTEICEKIMNYAETVANVTEYPFDKVASRILLHPSKPNILSHQFWEVYAENAYDGIANTFFQDTFAKRIRYKVRKIAKFIR